MYNIDSEDIEDIDRKMFFKLIEGSRTRRHKAALVKKQCRLGHERGLILTDADKLMEQTNQMIVLMLRALACHR